jgi:hypothetical protein
MKLVEKILSGTDTGESNTHQAGWLVPKNQKILSFFPPLNATLYNPRSVVDVVDEFGHEWTFHFIYYNNRLHGKGTRNEYRLTRVTEFVRQHGLKKGDIVILEDVGHRHFNIRVRRKGAELQTLPDGRKVLKLSGNWLVVDSG